MRNNNYNTKQKELILKVIKSKHSLFTINEIHAELDNKVGLTTIYRLIDKLLLTGELTKIVANNIVYYQYLEKCSSKNHFYLKCDRCNELIHIDCECINELSKHILSEHKFIPNNKKIIINGICENCQNIEEENG